MHLNLMERVIVLGELCAREFQDNCTSVGLKCFQFVLGLHGSNRARCDTDRIDSVCIQMQVEDWVR